MENVLVTGGAGFIGSHLVDRLMSNGARVHIIDNFTSGTMLNIKPWLDNPNLTVRKGDLLDSSGLAELSSDRFETVFHLAANPEVRVGSTDPDEHFQQNLVATKNLLECLRKKGNSVQIAFASTSTVYGEPTKIPTPEDYSPLEPISVYGATKLASEALISAFAHTYGFKAVIYRLANVVGPRSIHGVIRDFVQKLEKNPHQLEILGDGTQNKSYLHVSDCIEALILGTEKPKHQLDIYNVGSEDQIGVKEIAQLVIKKMSLKNVKLTYTGGVDGGRGWKGDVKNMFLDISRIKSLGWKPQLNSRQAVERTAKELVKVQELEHYPSRATANP